MKIPDIPDNEQERLATLRSLHILDTPAEQRFDSLTRIAQRVFNVPVALVSLVDEKRQWFKSCIGMTVRETSREMSFCGHAILDDVPFIVPDATADERFFDNPLVTNEPYVHFYAGIPLKAHNGHKLGVLCVMDQKPRVFSQEDLGLLMDLAKIAENELSIVLQSNTDYLTNILNRRGFELVAQSRLNLCSREKIPASLVFIDLDKFKYINDSFGHAEGDQVLVTFAKQMKSTFRDSDIIARLGGDEFVVLVTNIQSSLVCNMVSRLAMALDKINRDKNYEYKILFSHGVVEYIPDKHTSIETLLADGDVLMYKTKRSKPGNEQPTDFCI